MRENSETNRMQKLAGIKPVLKEEKESKKKSPIDMDKLFAYANAIEVLCNGEYGVVFYNENSHKVFVMLGDSNPFDSEYLMWYMKDAISKDYEASKEIEIEIDNEAYPSGEGWKQIIKGKLIDMD